VLKNYANVSKIMVNVKFSTFCYTFVYDGAR
jgi:hypothetical protein